MSPNEPPDSSWLEKVRDESNDRSVDRSDWSEVLMDRLELEVDGDRDKGAKPSSLK